MRFPWKRVPLTLAGFPFIFNNDEKSSNMYLDAAKNETGWDRLRSIFLSTESAGISAELNSIYQSIFVGGITGMIYGGIKKSSKSFNTFININDATKFHNIKDARRQLQNEVSIGFIKGAYSYGWKVALFTGSYVGLSTIIAAYRGKSSIIEYTIAGGITGMMYKAPLGPRAMISGGTVGVVLSTLAGGLTLLMLKATGSTVEEVRYWQLHFKNARDTKIRESFIEARRAKESAVFLMHDDMVKDTSVEKQLDVISEKMTQEEKSLEKKEDSKK